jgi:predicted ferric reductase
MQTGELETFEIERRLGKRIRPLRSLAESVWIRLYLLLIALPLLILIVGQVPKGGGFWWDFSMGLGFTGLTIMGLQFVLTARFRGATAPFGIDIIYFFHRWVAIVGIVLVLGHYLILRTKYGAVLPPLNPAEAPWHMTAGRLALIIFLGLY